MNKEKQEIKENKKITDFKQSKPDQLTLFEIIDPKEKKYSNTIELYDFVPKYKYGKIERINGKYLDSFEREFECRGVKYHATITPTSVKGEDGEEKFYYPGKREELVEDALRKLATAGQGVFLDEEAGVTFSLYQLQQELKRTGHDYNITQLKEALFILSGTILTLKSEDGKGVIRSSLFKRLGLNSREDWEKQGKKEVAYIKFNELVTKSIKEISFKQINYEKAMSYDSTIARQLHKRMSHHFTQAGWNDPPYCINLTTLIRDFGITPYKWLSHNLRDIVIALEEMKNKDVIRDYEIYKTLDGEKKRGTLIEAKIAINPGREFIDDAVKSNKRSGKYSLPPVYFKQIK